MTGLTQFWFSSGEMIRAEGGKGDVVHRPKAPDKVGVRQIDVNGPETRRARPVWPNTGGLRLDRTFVRPSPTPLTLNQTGLAEWVNPVTKRSGRARWPV